MHTLIRFACCGLLAVTVVACKKAEPEAAPVAPVQVAPAIQGSIRHIVTADAVLYPREQANIMPKVTAPIRRFLVNRGDHVKQGQLLAELENRDLVAAAQESRGQFAQAESNYRSTAGAVVPEQVTKAQADVTAARESLDAAKKLLDNREQLFKEGALARKLVDEAQVADAQARAAFDTAQQHLQALQSVGKDEQIKTAAAQVESARGRYDATQAQVAYSEIRSPFAGVVTDRPLYPGELATTGVPVMTVMDMSKVVARINMAQDQAKDIKVGAEATLTASDAGVPVAGRVTVVSPASDLNSTTVQVWVQADNADERFRAGQSVHVSIVAATIDGATVIPAGAVLSNAEGETIVLVVDDKNIVHEKVVAIGVKEPEMVQVVSGIEAGDRVVTVGGVGLEDKAKVRVMKPGEKAAGEKEEKDDEPDTPATKDTKETKDAKEGAPAKKDGKN
jgi:multidrug efflux pump subunit AcrA (membrane-fusion protein)